MQLNITKSPLPKTDEVLFIPIEELRRRHIEEKRKRLTSIGMEYVDQDEKDDEKNDNNDGIYDDIDSDQDSIPLSELLDQSDINQMDAKGSCASAEIKETSVGPYIFHEIRIV
ncbi:MAG: hypothetical protein EZS28_002073 [Streblomastix strix]|uniref:Uncharacterized protein n=1 Tax=Streblomastix strix TaxID=222440 RepID=A0A5J4X6X8_9EUKA|nr:MAG: hypothetical protein EZS28_002073 [Streblomastix strix]